MSKGFITGTNEELIKAYKESRDESYLKDLIEANKGLINLLVSPYLTSIPNSELEDLTSESYIPMLRAIEDYDPEQGVAFSTLLKVYVRQHLNRLYNEANKDEKDKDKQVQLWERGLTDIKNLIGLAGEYGDLTKRDIKIKRSGAKGSLKTTYQYFPKDPSEMEIPEPQNLVGSLILDLDREDQIKAIEGRLQLNKGNNNDSNNDSGAGATRVF